MNSVEDSWFTGHFDHLNVKIVKELCIREEMLWQFMEQLGRSNDKIDQGP